MREFSGLTTGLDAQLSLLYKQIDVSAVRLDNSIDVPLFSGMPDTDMSNARRCGKYV